MLAGGGTHDPRGFRIEVARPPDAEDVARVVREAFATETVRYRVEWLPPLGETAEMTLEAMREGVVLKAVDEPGGEVVGSVRGIVRGGVCEIGRLVVVPAARGRGIGRALMERIEREFPSAEVFELFTGHLSEGPLHVYETMGYERVRSEMKPGGVELITLAKRRT